MKVLIIEDEKAAVRNLLSLLNSVDHEAEVIGTIDNIADCIDWLKLNTMPNLIFMDIHLADGSAFEIFEHINITCPIIFTTAYDEYALRAFKVNSIDYLLKPISQEDFERAINKWKSFKITTASTDKLNTSSQELSWLMRKLKLQENYKTHFLIPTQGDKLLPIPINEIHYFYIKDGQVKAMMSDGKSHSITQNLDELTTSIDPTLFFRVNRQYLLSRESIRDISLWFNSRLSINLKHPTADEKPIVSKSKVAEFKEWFSRKKS